MSNRVTLDLSIDEANLLFHVFADETCEQREMGASDLKKYERLERKLFDAIPDDEKAAEPVAAPQWHAVYIAGCAGESYHVASFPQGDETCLALTNQIADGLAAAISGDDQLSIFNDEELAEHKADFEENYHA